MPSPMSPQQCKEKKKQTSFKNQIGWQDQDGQDSTEQYPLNATENLIPSWIWSNYLEGKTAKDTRQLKEIISATNKQALDLMALEECWHSKARFWHFKIKGHHNKSSKPPPSKAKQLLPVQTVHHIPHCADEILVFLGATDNGAVELLHVRVNGVESGCLSATCMRAVQNKHLTSLHF